MKKWFYMALAFMATASCEKRQMDDCITSLGPERTITREVPSFHQIKLTDKFDVVLVQDDSLPESVTLTGGMNLFDGIDTKVKDGVLVIEDKNTCNFVRSFKERVKVVIRLRKIDRIEIHSVVKITTRGALKLNNLDIFHMGLEDVALHLDVSDEVYIQSINSGALNLTGNSKILKGSIEEISILDARFLACEQVLIDNHSRLDCYVNATRVLYVKIYNDGNIWYVQEPSELKEVNVRKGNGDLLKL